MTKTYIFSEMNFKKSSQKQRASVVCNFETGLSQRVYPFKLHQHKRTLYKDELKKQKSSVIQ